MRAIAFLLAVLGLSVAACGSDGGEDACDLCVYPERCEDGACTRDCVLDVDCGDEKVRCLDGTCTDRCEGVICDPGFLCERRSGDCVPDPETACRSDADCEDDSRRCTNGACVPKCQGVTCNVEAGEICNPRTGACVGGVACDVTADCQARPGRGSDVCQDGICVGGRFSGCDAETPCASGLDCIGNAGYLQICAAPCDSVAECAVNERCPSGTAGEGSAYDDHCLPNLCRPGGDPNGFFQDTEYMGPCDAAADGDGICVGPLPSGDGYQGFCFGNGTAAPGQPCRADQPHGSALACDRGFCAGAENGQQGICLSWCSPFDDLACPPLGDLETGCFPLVTIVGVCGAMADEVGEPLGPCTQVQDRLSCPEGYVCGARPGTMDLTCVEYCMLEDPTPEGLCEQGTCTEIPGSGNPLLGYCAL